MAELLGRFPRPGRIEAILLRPARRADPVEVGAADVTERGLEGDHGSAGKRALTLIQAEHLPVISALAAREATSALLRRNLVVSGLNLGALRGARLRLGEVEIEVTGPCAPCSRMEEALGEGGYNAVRGHGGWCARVLEPGRLSVGDAVTVLVSPHRLGA
jgi:MOSC domain-containing protein YiiM